MKFKTKNLTILVIIGLIFPLFLNYSYTFNIKHDYNLIEPKESAGYSESFIHIDGSIPDNWTDTLAESWCNFVNGFYVIENVTIDASSSPTGSGIFINNSKNELFIIRNCSVQYAGAGNRDAGIRLENTSNGTLIENNCSNNGRNGIFLYTNCYNNTITNNTANNNAYLGIGIYGINGVPSSQCVDNIVENNIANDNDLHGIVVAYYCQNTTVVDNECSFNGQYGIFLYRSCLNNYIINNTANNNGVTGEYAGIYLSDNCNYNNVTGNNASNEGTTYQDRGIYIYNGCDENNITRNTANDNSQVGIYLYNGCDDNNITGNTVNDNSQIGIYLYVNCDDNVIKSNTINRNELGIALRQCDYINVSENILKDNGWCIIEDNCIGNIIENNDCLGSTLTAPIFINGAATGVGAHNWTWAKDQPWCSGSGTWKDPYIIENLKISGFGFKDGIEIQNSDVYFIIQNCEIYNSYNGIYLSKVNNSRLTENNCSINNYGIHIRDLCNNNTISGNTANNNEYIGISVVTLCNNNTISGNTANNNEDNGIYIVEGCMNNTISGNIINDNGDSGIFVGYLCNNNTISGNTANDNVRAGIYLTDSDYNNITENTASGNNNGIFLDDENNNNIIAENIFNNNEYGIEIYYSNFNSIIGNTANDNIDYGIRIEGSNSNTISGNNVNNNTHYGMFIETQSDNNAVSGNTVNNNKDTGIHIDDDCDYNDIIENIVCNNSLGIYLYSDCGNNSIYKNFFLKNGKHADDDGTDNKWNSTIIGNYWDNHTGPDVSPQDGIVDDPYTYIGGSAGSIDYLPIAEDGAPRITINSPIEGERFGSTTPTFNVEIIDIYVFEMWYTLDGGLNNYTFTVNGTIDQSAWDALPDGRVTITFYARDIVGNEAFEEVTVIKGISAGGLDPGVIVAIVVVSVVGGLAVIGAAYIFLKKRRASV